MLEYVSAQGSLQCLRGWRWRRGCENQWRPSVSGRPASCMAARSLPAASKLASSRGDQKVRAAVSRTDAALSTTKLTLVMQNLDCYIWLICSLSFSTTLHLKLSSAGVESRPAVFTMDAWLHLPQQLTVHRAPCSLGVYANTVASKTDDGRV